MKKELERLECAVNPSLESIFGAGVALGVAATSTVMRDPLSETPRAAIANALQAAHEQLTAIARDARASEASSCTGGVVNNG